MEFFVIKGGNNKNKRKQQEYLEHLKQQKILDEALERYKKETGIDYMKWLMGDERERMKYKFRQWQDKMKDDLSN
jgi:hypothetical protein